MAVASPSVAAAAGRGDQEDRPPTSMRDDRATGRGGLGARGRAHADHVQGAGRSDAPRRGPGCSRRGSTRRATGERRAGGGPPAGARRQWGAGAARKRATRSPTHGRSRRAYATPRRSRLDGPPVPTPTIGEEASPPGRVGTGRRTCPAHAGQNIPLRSQVPLGVTPVRREPAEVHASIPG